MSVTHLTTVDGFVAFDFDDAPVSAGGTRFASDVTEDEACLLARAMTYKFGVLERQIGGAKGAVRGTPEERETLMARYCAEIKPMADDGRFLTGADLGTRYADFASLRDPGAPPHVMASVVGGVDLEDLITGFGVVVAAEASLGSVEGLTFALEGFGKVGGGLAREIVRRGGRVVAVSTLEGCVTSEAGLDVELMAQLRSVHGDAFVFQMGAGCTADRAALFDVRADVVVPGARTGVITPQVAERLACRTVVPASNVPYTREALDVLRARRIGYLADFVCNAGATIGFVFGGDGPGDVFRTVERVIATVAGRAAADPRGPYEGACALAEAFLETWRGPQGMPDGPPLA